MSLVNFVITPEGLPNDGIMFVDHQKENRTGHLGHALVEYEPGKVLAFYPNCSAEDPELDGHSGYGWMEYKRSVDGGQTWSPPIIEPNSKALFDEACGRTMMCEKAVCTDIGRIVLFYLQSDMITDSHGWEPFFNPLYAISDDYGHTFTPAKCFVEEAGRIYDAKYYEGVIYVLYQRGATCITETVENDPMALTGQTTSLDSDLLLYVSEDNGESFTLRSRIPFANTNQVYYGTMTFRPDGSLLVYTYDRYDEHNLKYNISCDCGRTWGINRRAFFEKRLRNPQIVYFGGEYFIHGRTGNYGQEENRKHFVLYTSKDGINWDEGHYVRMAKAGYDAYSNNLIVHMPDGTERLLIHVSQAYEGNKTNIVEYWISKK